MDLPVRAYTAIIGVSVFGKHGVASLFAMLPRTTNHLLLAVSVAALLAAAPVNAQGLGLQLDLGDIDVDVGVGGGKGLDVGVGVGDELNVDLGVGGDAEGALDLDVDLGPGGAGSLNAVDDATSARLGQEAALQAVKRGRALPLDEIMLRASLLTDGEIIDAQLIDVRDVLLYELKVLDKGGKVSQLYMYARSGLPVE